ncbi:hypothetical protein BpHYR1_053994 [Brachionus plicatilis]|uniref:Uncharacterized protein n=1 Tax=Brachionus plicatilis TaxID=10195 RepID=A0A3M7S564_BRAPC|nr:hypothetical protein BpHYR1_053994 [Brachionus plicatilis]
MNLSKKILKNRKVLLTFSIIIFVVLFIQFKNEANFLKTNSKDNTNDQKNSIVDIDLEKNYINFWNSLKVYSNYYFRLPISFVTKNDSWRDFSSDGSQQFATINRILFTNKAILGDPNIYTKNQ